VVRMCVFLSLTQYLLLGRHNSQSEVTTLGGASR
jgi:hypothetical protein